MSVKEGVYNEAKNKSEKFTQFRNGDITQHLTSVDIEEVVRIGGVNKYFTKALSVIILITICSKSIF